MSRRINWEKDHERQLTRLATTQSRDRRHTSQRSPKEAEKLASIIEQAKTAKRAGLYFKMPGGISKADCKLIWARTLSELRSGVSITQ